MMIFLFLAPLFYELSISVVLSALQTQKGSTETDKYGGSFHERLSRMEAMVLADNALNEKLSNLEKEIKRIGEENKLLRDVVKNQDYSLKHLTDEIRKLQSDNGELKRFCKETFGRMIARIEDESYQNILLSNEPKAHNTTEIINPLRFNITTERTERKYKVASPLDQDARNRNLLGENDLFQPRRTRQLQDKRVAFYTTLSATISNLGVHHPIIFNTVITNIGEAYHPHTGIFIAPVDGVYVFHLCAMSEPRKWQFFELVKDGDTMQLILPDALNIHSHITDSHTAVLQLHQGNEVWVRTGQVGSGEIHGNGISSFAGWLLYS